MERFTDVVKGAIEANAQASPAQEEKLDRHMAEILLLGIAFRRALLAHGAPQTQQVSVNGDTLIVTRKEDGTVTIEPQTFWN